MDNYAQGDTGPTGTYDSGTNKSSDSEGALTCGQSDVDFKFCWRAKKDLIKREHEDFKFALGDQWSQEDKETMRQAGIKPVVDNRIQPNLFLLTGLERQNRADFKAFPIGEEDGIKAEIASLLFKDIIKKSHFGFKASDMFKDGIICGESHLELYLDFTESLINGKPVWKKVDGNMIFWDPESREYDLSDARFVYKMTTDIEEDDLVSMFPDKEEFIRAVTNGKIDTSILMEGETTHLQKRDYGREGLAVGGDESGKKMYDLLERYYRKFVKRHFVGDRQTGQINQAEDEKTAKEFIKKYHKGIRDDAKQWQQVQAQTQAASQAQPGKPIQMPPAPPAKDPNRFVLISRMVPEIWYYAHIPGTEEPLADKTAWCFPNWKNYPFIPFFCRFSTAPLHGDDRHLRIQGLVHGVKGAQEKHNKAEMLLLRHLNSSTNSGWLTEENTWVDPDKVKKFGSAAGVNLEYKAGKAIPQRIEPAQLSQAHATISADSSESIKAQLGINADLLAANESSGDSGRAISLRQKQGLLMVQELFDNLSRSRAIAGRFVLSQMNEVYDTELAKKVLGDGFLTKNFPPPMIMNPDTMQQEPMTDPKTGAPMQYDEQMADLAIAEVLSGHLEDYEVTVGESVASETQRLANSAELTEFTKLYPGLIPPEVLIKNSQLPESTKRDVLEAIQRQQQAAMAQAAAQHPNQAPPNGGK